MLITVFHMHSTVGKEFLREVSTVYNKHWNKYFLLKKINEFECALSHLSKFNGQIIIYPSVVWSKFKLFTYNLKFDWNLNCLPIVWNSWCKCFETIFFYLIWSWIFIFLEKRYIKVE